MGEAQSALPGMLQAVAEVVGDEKALALGRLFSGSRTNWPSRAVLDRLERDQTILKLVGPLSVTEVAKRFGISRTQVYRIIRRARGGRGK